MDVLLPLPATVIALAVLTALAVDRWLGEPAVRWHPVVWMGHYLKVMGQWFAPMQAVEGTVALRVFAAGMLAWCLGVGVVATLAWLLSQSFAECPLWVQGVLLGVMLKPLMAWRMLHDEVQAVETALGHSLQDGRERLSWLVSRPVDALSEEDVRASAIESLAENLNDSVIAPLFWFAMAGLPGAAVYRLANTADAMWGYVGRRGDRDWSWAGKWAARADDLLSWIPARLTALLLCLPTHARVLGRLLGEARKTPSPNSGWPMAAMALALNVSLRKPGVYVLHPQGRAVAPQDTALSLQLAQRVVLSVAAVSAVCLMPGVST